MEPLKDLGVTTLTPRDTGGTNHLAFDTVGIPGFQFIQDPLDYSSRSHHSNMDTYERLQPADLAQAAVVEAIFVYNTAMRDRMLPRKPLPHPELEEQRLALLTNIMPGAEAARAQGERRPNSAQRVGCGPSDRKLQSCWYVVKVGARLRRCGKIRAKLP